MTKSKTGALSSGDKSWYKDKYQSVLVQRNILAVSTLVAMLVALVATIVILNLAPLKSVEPFVIQIDEKTGITQTIEGVKPTSIYANASLAEYFIVKYIRAREDYDIATARFNFEVVRLTSTQEVYREFVQSKNQTNPSSPAALLGVRGKRLTTIKSISKIPSPDLERRGKRVISVRVTLTDNFSNRPPTTYDQIITMTFEFTNNLQLKKLERYVNPIGFRVSGYTIREENR